MTDMGRRNFLKTALLMAGAVPLGAAGMGVDPPGNTAIDVTPGKTLSAMVGWKNQSLRFEGYVDQITVTMSTQGGTMDIKLRRWPMVSFYHTYMSGDRTLHYECTKAPPPDFQDVLEFKQMFGEEP